MTTSPSPKSEPTPCECSLYEALVNIREDARGDLIWDDEITTGCSGEKTKHTFRPGHDAKLKSLFIKAAITPGADLARLEGGMRVSADPLGFAKEYGFETQVRKGIANAELKLATKVAKTAERAAKKAARGNGRAAKKLTQASKVFNDLLTEAIHEQQDSDDAQHVAKGPQTVTAKVGRWVKTGEVDQDGLFHYLDSKDVEQVTAKYTLIG